MASQNTSNTNILSTVTERKRASATSSSSASAANNAIDTSFLGRKKKASADDKIKALTEPTVCTEDCKLKISPETIFDYEAAIRHHLERLRTHSEAKNTMIWTRKELDEDGKWQKKKPYQVEEPKVTEGEETEAAKKRKNYREQKKKMDKMDEELEKLYGDLPRLLGKLQERTSKESDLYHLLSTRNQFWPSIKSLSRDPIIDELKEAIAEKTSITNTHGSILTRSKDKMFKNCFEVFYGHGIELENLTNKLLVLMKKEAKLLQAKRKRLDEKTEIYELKKGEFEKIIKELPVIINKLKRIASPVSHLYQQLNLMEGRSGEEEFQSEAEPLQAKRKRLSEEEEIQNVVMSNLKKVAHPVQSTRLLVEDILEELEKRLSSSIDLVPLTYKKLEKALGEDIRPILRKFLMDSSQTVDNTVRELIQLSNNQPCTPNTILLLVPLRDSFVWKTIIFDWLAKKRAFKTDATVPDTKNDDDFLEVIITNHIPSPRRSGVQNEKSVDLSSNNSAIRPFPANEWEKQLHIQN